MVTLLNDWSAAWGPYFLTAVVQNLLFLALVFMALYWLRNAPARVRAAVATVGLIKLAVPPFVTVDWLSRQAPEQVIKPVQGLLFPFADLGTGETAAGSAGLSVLTVLMMIWASVALARLGWGAVQTLQLALDVRGAERLPTDEVPAEITDAGLTVWLSPRIRLPLTHGVRPRRIFVPASWRSWPAASRLAVLRHELAHVRRHDGIVQTLEILIQAVFFFLPPVTWLVRRLHTYREMACDDASVAADPAARLAYSRLLCNLAESILEIPPTTASASALARRRCELMDRVSYQVKEGVMTSMTRRKVVGILAVLAVAALPLSLVYGVGHQAEPAPPAPPAKAETEVEAPAAPDAVAAVAAPAGEQEVKVKKGEKPPKDAPPPPPPAIKLTLKGDQVRVGDKPVQPGELKQELKKVVSEKGTKCVVSIDGKGDVTMKQLHGVQRDLRDLGLMKVVYSGDLGESVPLVLPPDTARKKLQMMPPEQLIHVKVDGEGIVTVDGMKVKGAKLSKVIAKELAVEPHRVVVLHTTGDATYGAFVQTLREVKAGGADKIAVADPE